MMILSGDVTHNKIVIVLGRKNKIKQMGNAVSLNSSEETKSSILNWPKFMSCFNPRVL